MKAPDTFVCAICKKPIKVGQNVVRNDDGTVSHADCVRKSKGGVK